MTTKLALVFPGQGSQSVGMLSELVSFFPQAQTLCQKASQILDFDLWTLIAEGSAEQLNQTRYTQPAMLVSDIAFFEFWQSRALDKPLLLAGHSLGEYAALVAAQALDFADAVKLVERRAMLMQEAVADNGAMGVILGLSVEQVTTLCEEVSTTSQKFVQPANFNSPIQTVVSGMAVAVDQVLVLARQQGAKIAKRLPVSIPAHCALMRPIAKEFEKDLARVPFKTPAISIIHNFDVQSHAHPDDIREVLVQQLFQPVRWIESVEKMKNEGEINTILECGPGKVLTGLNKRICPDIDAFSLGDVQYLQRFNQ